MLRLPMTTTFSMEAAMPRYKPTPRCATRGVFSTHLRANPPRGFATFDESSVPLGQGGTSGGLGVGYPVGFPETITTTP